jgi:cytochrome c peroxidase
MCSASKSTQVAPRPSSGSRKGTTGTTATCAVAASPYFHDGSAATLLDVVNRYNDDPRFALGLSEKEKSDLVEFLKTL